jgi:hypothetical protein
MLMAARNNEASKTSLQLFIDNFFFNFYYRPYNSLQAFTSVVELFCTVDMKMMVIMNDDSDRQTDWHVDVSLPSSYSTSNDLWIVRSNRGLHTVGRHDRIRSLYTTDDLSIGHANTDRVYLEDDVHRRGPIITFMIAAWPHQFPRIQKHMLSLMCPIHHETVIAAANIIAV